MIGTVSPEFYADAPSARLIPRLFSNGTRCSSCRRSGRIWALYDPGCREASGPHFHRECPCGATWLERSAGHGGFVSLDDPTWVLVCQACRCLVRIGDGTGPRCCREPEVSYHDVKEPCDLCAPFTGREPGCEG